MNFDQLEVQMDSVLYSLRQRFRRASASTPTSSQGGQSPVGTTPNSSSAASPISRRGRGLSLRSRNSLKRLMRGRLFLEEDGEERAASRQGNGTSKAPSDENLAWTAPVSPQSQPRANAVNPRRRNSARLRELQALLRAYHEQREAWLSPPASPKSATKRESGSQELKEEEADGKGKSAKKNSQKKKDSQKNPKEASSSKKSPQSPRIPSHIGITAASVPLHYSRAELGPARPLHLPITSPKSSLKKSPERGLLVEARKRITLSELELALRGGGQPEALQAWSPQSGTSSSPHSGPSSSMSPVAAIGSPQLPPKPPRLREGSSPSPPPVGRKKRDAKKGVDDAMMGENADNYIRVESPRPRADVHFQEDPAKEVKQQKPPKATAKIRAKSPNNREEVPMASSTGVGASSVFSPAGIQQLLFRHRQRRQSESRVPKEGRREENRSILVKPARSEPRLARSAFPGARPDSLASSLAALSLSPSSTALEHLERLRDRVSETKYVTAAFESRGGLGPVLDDVQTELEHWLGVGSRLLAVACEVHWSVPERFRSRQMEIQLKECLHAVLRENNRRILGVDDDLHYQKTWSGILPPAPFPIILAKSRTEESCARDPEADAFQGIYRRFYPALLSLQDPATVQAHKGYWTLENMADGRRSPPVPRPAKFLYQPAPAQLARKSLVAVNMAVLRLRGDVRDYDADEQREEKEAQPKKKRFLESFF